KSKVLTADNKFEFFRDVTTAYFKLNPDKDRKPGYDKVREVLDKHAAGTSLLHTVTGYYYVNYAWDARTAKFADKVSDEQMKLFEERLKLAAQALEKAWDLDEKNARAASRRITVAMGLSEKRAVVDRWFERAKTASPNSLDAYRAKMLYLEPKW